MVLIDSGASQNLISTELVKQLGIVKEYTTSYMVKLGDGHMKETNGCGRNLEVELEGFIFNETFFFV